MKIIRIFYICLICTSLYSPVFAQGNDKQSFADFLFEKGEYYRAITEYYRLIHNSNDLQEKNRLLKNIGFSYYYGMDFEGCIDFISNNRSFFAYDPDLGMEMDFVLAKSYYKIQKYKKAISTLQWINPEQSEPFFNDALFLFAFSQARLFRVEQANETLKRIKTNSEKKELADKFSNYFRQLNNVSNKSPLLAATLSAVIPGAGYLYAEHYETALTSFIINGLLIWAVHDAIREEQYGIAAAGAVFGLGWYIGNIEGSATAAIRQNEYERRQYVNEVFEHEGLIEYTITNN